MTFDQLDIAAPILQALRQQGYTAPTPIQEKAIPAVLAGHDLLGCAQTGTGKTAAFSIPIIQRLDQGQAYRRRGIKALVLTPTRELAIQIDQSFADYGRHTAVRHTVIFGGVGQQPQADALRRGVDVLVATPGRLLDLIGQRIIDLGAVEHFVLDEADRMLDMGFIHDIRRIVPLLPRRRQTLLFSATMPAEIEALADTILNNPQKVAVAPPATTVELIDQSLYFVEKADKKGLLIELLQDPAIDTALVFSRTKYGADKIARYLNRAGVKAEAIHGEKSQNARQRALSNFKEHKTKALVATDIAARGIDVDDLGHVFNHDLSEVPETYVHRIGRTGRAGKGGVAISFCSSDELQMLRDIQRLIGKEIPVVRGHAFESPLVTDALQAAAAPKQPKQPKKGRPAQNERTPNGQGNANGKPQQNRAPGSNPGGGRRWRGKSKPKQA